MYRSMVRFIKKGQTEGIFRKELNPELTAHLFSYVHYFMFETIQQYPKRRGEIADIGRQGLDILIRGVLQPGVQFPVCDGAQNKKK